MPLRVLVGPAEARLAQRGWWLGERSIIDVYIAAKNGMIDDVIDPRETRHAIIRALDMAENKHVDRPKRKHGEIGRAHV